MEELKEKIYKLALLEHKQFESVSKDEMMSVIRIALKEIEIFENASTPDLNKNLKALWVFSGPGNYHGVVMGERYSQYEWAKNMDKERLDYAIELASVWKRLYKSTLPVIYNGGDDQNAVVREMIRNEDLRVKEDELIIMGSGINNTLDQIKTFILPENLHTSGGEVGIVSHAPQVMRILHMMSKYKTIPQDMNMKVFAIPTPNSGKEEYAISEVKGLLYYLFLSKDALVQSYPYKI